MLLLDNSAWARRHRDPVRRRFASALRERACATSLPFLLEAGFSAQTKRDHSRILQDLSSLPRVAIAPSVEKLALDAQSDLARIGHHRLALIDILIAACAHETGAGVLHYDKDYDVLREHTRLRFRSEWLAPVGSLD
jgi:predicted nucleic acid-binding protein